MSARVTVEENSGSAAVLRTYYDTLGDARRGVNSCYAPAMRAKHNIIRWWSAQDSRWKYSHQFDPAGTKTLIIRCAKPRGMFDTDNQLAAEGRS